MTRLADMARRLPALYRDGDHVRGLLGVAGIALDILDEDAREVQRSHWFDTALERDEVAALAALLGLTPRPWQDVAQFRAWVHATRDALLERGAVTTRALKTFVTDYSERFQAALGERILAPTTWGAARTTEHAVLLENPPVAREQRVVSRGKLGVAPLEPFVLTNRGLDETALHLLLVGLPDAPECCPVIVNVTTGEALVFLGRVPIGQRLFVSPAAGGGLRARLEQADVSDRFRIVDGVVPGTPWPRTAAATPGRALRLARGDNQVWFLALAHYDEPGLDRFLLALPDLTLQNGRFDESAFDRALFHMRAAVQLRVSWTESAPATFRIEVPVATLSHRPGMLADAENARDQLLASLDETVSTLRAAGVASHVVGVPFDETQPQRDVLLGVEPIVLRERGPTGVDRHPTAGGVFSITRFDDSTYR